MRPWEGGEQDYCQILQPKGKRPAVAESIKKRVTPLENNRRKVKNRTPENHKGAAPNSCYNKVRARLARRAKTRHKQRQENVPTWGSTVLNPCEEEAA